MPSLWQSMRRRQHSGPPSGRLVSDTLDRACDCPAEDDRSYVATELDGQRTAEFPIPVESVSGALITAPPRTLWIDDIFGIIVRALRSGAVIDVRYDQALGYPEFVEIGPDEQYEIRDFELVPPDGGGLDLQLCHTVYAPSEKELGKVDTLAGLCESAALDLIFLPFATAYIEGAGVGLVTIAFVMLVFLSSSVQAAAIFGGTVLASCLVMYVYARRSTVVRYANEREKRSATWPHRLLGMVFRAGDGRGRLFRYPGDRPVEGDMKRLLAADARHIPDPDQRPGRCRCFCGRGLRPGLVVADRQRAIRGKLAEASSFFRAAITSEDWEMALEGPAHRSVQLDPGDRVGRIRDDAPRRAGRRIRRIPVQYVVPNKENAVETVTAMKDLDGAWRVGGYYIPLTCNHDD